MISLKMDLFYFHFEYVFDLDEFLNLRQKHNFLKKYWNIY